MPQQDEIFNQINTSISVTCPQIVAAKELILKEFYAHLLHLALAASRQMITQTTGPLAQTLQQERMFRYGE